MQRKVLKRSRFPETRWSLVRRAAGSDDLTRQQALSELLRSYSPGLRSFLIRVRGVPASLSDDLIQDFVADKILAKNLIGKADQGRGKFRSFILKSLNNFVNTRLKKEAATQNVLSPLEDDVADTAPAAGTDGFDQVWVEQVVQDAIRLMHVDCQANDRLDIWHVFEMRIVNPMLHGAQAADYESIVQQLGIQTPRQAINLLATGKRSFTRHLREAVKRYVSEEHVEAEIQDLQRIVGR